MLAWRQYRHVCDHHAMRAQAKAKAAERAAAAAANAASRGVAASSSGKATETPSKSTSAADQHRSSGAGNSGAPALDMFQLKVVVIQHCLRNYKALVIESHERGPTLRAMARCAPLAPCQAVCGLAGNACTSRQCMGSQMCTGRCADGRVVNLNGRLLLTTKHQGLVGADR